MTSANIAQELETLYGYQKQRIFQAEDPEEATKHLTLAHQILKTLIACNAINAEQGRSRHHTPKHKSTGGEKIISSLFINLSFVE